MKYLPFAGIQVIDGTQGARLSTIALLQDQIVI